MRVIVTGTTGFIGRHTARVFSGRGWGVLGIDNRPSAGLAGVRLEQCDLLDSDRLETLFEEFRPEAVVHLAARTDLDGRDLADYAANTVGVTNLLKAMRRTGTVRRAICVSSQLVCRIGYTPVDDNDYQPSTVYGESKVLTERSWKEGDGAGATWCIVRPTTIWGPAMNPHYLRFFRMIDRGTYFHVGRSPLRKSYGYVKNTVHQLGQLLESPDALVHGKTFYLADYEPLSLRDWAEGFRSHLGARRIPRVPIAVARTGAMAGDLLNRLGWKGFPFNSFRLKNTLTEYVYDLTDLERVCGPLPYTTDDGIRDTVEWLNDVWQRPGSTAVPQARASA